MYSDYWTRAGFSDTVIGMLHWNFLFLTLAVLAGMLGLAGLAPAAAIGRSLFEIFMWLFLFSLFLRVWRVARYGPV